MRLRLNIFYLFVATFFLAVSIFTGGCAQIGLPTGGIKDTIPPKLVKASPAAGSRNISSNKITFEFDEYIDVQDLSQNMLISPLQNRNPTIIANPRSITLKFRDTLLPNTTYTINFGDAVRDINENNILKDLSYIFSTGSALDSSSISGKVIVAETGNVDTTIIVMLYKNAVDSTVTKKKPNYIARLNKEGSFIFKNLPASDFKIYALKDGDGGKTYNAASELFAFTEADISAAKNESITLFAYAEKKEEPISIAPVTTRKRAIDKKLRYTTNIGVTKDLLEPMQISFNNELAFFDSSKIYLADSMYRRIPAVKYTLDSTAKIVSLITNWKAALPLLLIIDSASVKDSAGIRLAKNDTIKFITKRIEDYGKLTLRFKELDLTKNPVLQFLTGDVVKYSYPLTASEWTNNLFPPGDYGIRILYDDDKDGKWTPGNYKEKKQPEKAVTLPQLLSVKADWENEREINL
jgi:hypothetical protein